MARKTTKAKGTAVAPRDDTGPLFRRAFLEHHADERKAARLAMDQAWSLLARWAKPKCLPAFLKATPAFFPKATTEGGK